MLTKLFVSSGDQLYITGINSKTVSGNILYYSQDISIYKHNKNIVLYDKNNQQISSSLAPIDYDRYEIVDLLDSVLLFFAGKSISIIDKSGGMHVNFRLDPVKIGRCITKPFLYDKNHLILGTRTKDRIQILKYDFMSQARESQSSSWKLYGFTTINLLDKYICGILDGSLLVCLDADTCENKWNRFEAAKIQKGLFIYQNKVLYSTQGMLRSVWQTAVDNITIPAIRFHTLEYLNNNTLYATSKKGFALCAVNLLNQQLLWETNTKFIFETVFVPFKHNNEIINCIAARTNESIIILNVDTGQMIHSVPVSNATQIRVTDNFLLINQASGTTIIGEK